MLLDKVQEDFKQAQLARDTLKISTLRLLLSEIKNAEIALRQSSGQIVLSDDQVGSIIRREIKKRKEAAAAFRSGDREEQAQKEEAEAQVLEGYLPAQISDEELTKIVEETIRGLTSSDMGMIMKIVMGKVAGRADGGRVSSLVKEKLS